MTQAGRERGDPASLAVADCWLHIGVRGDRSCPELVQHVHCRNCPIHASAADGLLDREPPAGYAREWADHFARPPVQDARAASSLLVFRSGPEWLALRTSCVAEVADPRPIHSLPHRADRVVLGLANVRGELLVCVSLANLLGVGSAAASAASGGRQRVVPRLLVLRGEGGRLATPVDEVDGVHRIEERELQAVPTTVAKARATFTQGVFAWSGRSVGQLDAQLVLYALGRSLS